MSVLGPCKKCGKYLMRPHPTGLCIECRRKSEKMPPHVPDIPDPLKYKG